MFRPLAGLCALTLLVLGSATVNGDEKKNEKAAPSGVWVREANGIDLKVEFVGKDTVNISAFHDENGVTAVCKYTTDKDGRLKAKITEVKEKGEFKNKPAVGVEFSFTWKAKGDTATLDDLKGEELENAKPVLEGDYERKKEKKK